jgi:hypothetical protein
MTMILCRKRDDFVVLAADRLIGTPLGPCGERNKLVLHPRLPLAFAVGGMMRFYLASRSSYAWAMDHVAEFAKTITSVDELLVEDIARRLETLFQPAMTQERNRLQLFVGLEKNGKADVGVQIVSSPTITDDPTRFIPGDDYYVIPECIREFRRQDQRLNAMRSPSVTSAAEVGRLAREAIEEGIVQEASLHADGKNRVIGGRPDVVLVTGDGLSVLP